MFSKERQEKIVEILSKKSSVTVTGLEKLFGVSSETVRRDLLALEKEKKLLRIHGGAMGVVRSNQDKTFIERHGEYVEEKKQIAVCAASFVCEHDSIAVDSGSTATYFCEYLSENFTNLTVVVTSLRLFEILNKNKGFRVILCGGDYFADDTSFYGPLTVQMIKSLHVSKTFLAPVGVSLKFGLTDFHTHSAEIQRSLYDIADKVFAIADHSKIENGAINIVMKLDSSLTVITDSGLDDGVYNMYIENDIDLIRGE